MAQYVQKHRNTGYHVDAEALASEDTEAQSKLPKPETQATDELLDEIDSVLEENAQEFVQAYIQQGGE